MSFIFAARPRREMDVRLESGMEQARQRSVPPPPAAMGRAGEPGAPRPPRFDPWSNRDATGLRRSWLIATAATAARTFGVMPTLSFAGGPCPPKLRPRAQRPPGDDGTRRAHDAPAPR